MGFLIGSAVLIGVARDGSDISSLVKGRENAEADLSVISASELRHGVPRAKSPKTRAARLAFVEGILAATCLAHGLTLVTGNVRGFRRVPGLQCELWPPPRGWHDHFTPV